MTPEERRAYHRDYYHKNKYATSIGSVKNQDGRFVKQINLDSNIAEIIDMYITQELSTYVIGKHFSVDKTIINRILKNADIPLRNNSTSHKISSGRKNSRWTGHEEITGAYWSSVVYGATKARNLEFNITIEECWNLFLKQNRKCALTGVELCFAKLNLDFTNGQQTASLDRIDSNIGYVIDNIWWVHKRINMMKKELSVDDFIKYCTLVSEHRKKDEQ